MRIEFIRKTRDFNEIYGRNHRMRGAYFTFLLAPEPKGHSQVGIVVSKKVGKAVRRNLVKRRVRAWLRQAPEPMGSEGRRVLIIAREGSGEALWQDIASDLQKGFERMCDYHRQAR